MSSKIGVKEKNFIKFILTEMWAWYAIAFLVIAATNPHRILELTGVFFLASQAYKFSKWYYSHFIRQGKKDLIKYGKWALVTGASDGIGAAIAIELAGHGFSVVLIARTLSKLENVAQQCKERNSAIHTKIIVADFSRHDRICYPLIKREIEGLEIGLLVNNVGIANEVPERLHEMDEEFVRQCLEINTISTPTMSRMILPQMLERGRGAIMNIGSASAAHPTPMLSIYSSTKAYLNQLTSSIHYEYKDRGIDIICCAPYYVMSNLSGIKKETWLVCSAERFARDALRQLGYSDHSNPYWCHDVFEWMSTVYSNTPQRLLVMMEKSRQRNQHKVDTKIPTAGASASSSTTDGAKDQ